MGKLDGKVAIVTGSGGGIGRAVAAAFAREGARIVVNSRTESKVDSAAREIVDAGGEAFGIPGDVSRPDDAERIVAAALDRWGAIDVLVNNAAIAGPIAPLGRDDPADWLRALEINVYGPYLMTRTVAPAMRRNGGGKIIDVSSGAGRGAAGDLVPYRVTKAALLRLSTALAEQLIGDGIEINTIDVLATTEMVRELATLDDQDPVLAERMRGRLGGGEPTPEDNAPIFVWLASSASDGLYGRNFAWSMNSDDLDRLKDDIIASPTALRIQLEQFDGIGLSPAGLAFRERRAAR